MSDLHASFDRMHLGHERMGQHGQQGVRKQRSQRFTVNTSSSPSSHNRSIPPVPSLPYQAPPPPVQAQSMQTQSILPTPTDQYFSFSRDRPPTDYAQHDDEYGAQAYGSYATPSYNSAYSTPASSFQRSRVEQPVRAGLPNEWMGRGQGYEQQSYQGGYAALVGRPPPEDEVIPTAIVIKNIPFQIPKETLLGVMEDLRLPPPFAFNYHFDNGQFRGLAFANFRLPADAALTVSALNGFDIQGRKLRTEFKKVLKEGEKERIEREKALKRMRSQRELSEAGGGPPIGTWNRREASAPGGYAASSVGGEEEDYGRLVQGQFSSGMGSRHLSTRDYVPAPESVYSQPQGYSHSPPSDVGTSISARMAKTNSGSGSDVGQRHELDLNDPQALEIYSRVLIFKDDSLRDELAFARSLSPAQRRNVHLVAKKLGLEHRSVGAGDDRHVVVFKGGAAPSLVVPEASRPLRHSASTLGRQSSRDFPSSFLTPESASTASLRAKKSMPEIRPTYSNGRATSREGYATVGRRSPHAVNSVQGLFQQQNFYEPTPSIPAQFVESNDPGAETGDDGQGLAVRQPRGPEEERGFGKRGDSVGRNVEESQTAAAFEV